MEYCSITKRKAVLIHSRAWRHRPGVALSKRNTPPKVPCCTVASVEHSQDDKDGEESWCPGLGVAARWGSTQGSWRELSVGREMPCILTGGYTNPHKRYNDSEVYTHCPHVTVLVLILYYSYIR